MKWCITSLLPALVILSCGSPEQPGVAKGPFSEVVIPAESPSGQPRFHDSGDRLLMSWVETDERLAYLRFSTWDGTGWEPARTAASGNDWFVNWADTPGVVQLRDGGLLAFYLQRTGPQPYAYGVRVIRSADGDHWSEAIIPHENRLPVEYGFVSVVPEDDGAARLFWLDGTAMYVGEGDEGVAGGHGAHGPMALRSARLNADGRLGERLLVDERTCECCPTAAVETPGGAVVAYRDRSEDDIRDIALVRLTGGHASSPAIPQADGWEIAGCPVNGPAMAGDGFRLALAWFTGIEGGRVRLAFSDDGGETFGPAVRIDDGAPIGRVDAVLLESGEALVSWLEAGEDGGELRIRRVHADGSVGPSVVAASVASQRTSGMPKLALRDGHVWLAWVDVDEPARVRVVRAPLDAIR